MLRHIGEDTAADRVIGAVNAVLADGQVRTRDLGGTASTLEYADAISARLKV
jgi:isocitrate dehydrogenase (NAD+)